MIPFLPEMSAQTLPSARPGTPLLAPAGASSGLDFAGLLGAALPPLNGAAVVTLTPGSDLPDDAAPLSPEAPALITVPLLAERAAPTSLLPPPLLPTGRNLPLPGADLPEQVVVPQPRALAPRTLAPRTLEPRATALALHPRDPAAEGDPVPTLAEVPSPTTPLPPERDIAPRAALHTTLSLAAEPSADLPPALPYSETASGPEAVGAAPDAPADAPASDPERDPEQPVPALAITFALQVTEAPLPAPPAAAPSAAAPPDAVVASIKRPLAPRLAVSLPGQATIAPPANDAAAPPVDPAPAVAAAKQEPASPAALPASPGSAPAPAAAPLDVAPAAADPASPAAPPTTAPPPVPTALAALAPAQSPAATPVLERADLRAEAPSPQQQSTIDQFGDLREALRSARPAMMLQHAEFGAVSLRLEATGSEGWRAVLASRDPGFVPAIQAALAERAVMAAAASPDSGGFTGQNGASQNSTSEHRSGSSPNGGQGASQPYLGQSGSRDGEAAPDHRRPSTAAALAARAEAEEAGTGSPGQGSGGLFA